MSEPPPDGRLPQVSIGMPVYNGASSLPEVLESLTGQTMRGLEIILSDNASTDETADICRRFAARDPRIRYFRQPAIVPVTDNFSFVLAQARAPYFMWAAHDDLRDADYVERLAAALDRNDGAILAFGDVVEIIDGVPRPLALRFANGALSPAARLRSAALPPLHHLYGLWRREPLRRIRWRHNEWWHDTPPMMAATMLGEFVHVPGVVFRYRYNRHPFFDWRRRPGFSGLLFAAARFGRRLGDLARLVWNSAVTVGEVAGFGYGLLAGWFALRKVSGQICGYIMRHGVSFRHSGVAARRGPAI
jgi:glycosyltransferase involved in cell wall biosynthesis